ncbi:hypothetical protein [Burkholderia pseudomallei]|uniref:hypothetical protein n=1 Tax=Burkholderia pseudomallei TaxID=28450 RepID=UPI0005374DE7|nr:hypothetical protein [Burkholderia pseudomallei]KGX66115.1 hypothetical protein Y027_6075 [Burkholderia pseudomallei TSV5]KGX66389.1 hypothetical protein Y025_6016 [Burkholderia pseudomallei TSV32]
MPIQQFHPGIRLGRQPTLATLGNPLFSRQDTGTAAARSITLRWHSPCPGKLAAPVYLPYHASGPHQNDSVYEPSTLLLIDPVGNEPDLAGFNARVDWHGDEQFRYRSPAAARGTKLSGGVSIYSIIDSISDV